MALVMSSGVLAVKKYPGEAQARRLGGINGMLAFGDIVFVVPNRRRILDRHIRHIKN